LATIFGLATSLGFGATQAATGLNFLFGFSNDLSLRVIIIAGITFFAVLSVIRGLDKGVKILSNINMVLAAILLIGVFLLGATTEVFISIFVTLKDYFLNMIPLSGWTDRPDQEWMQSWTVFYWAWWISWSPFVGMFIARISKGRTIAEFLIAVLIVPTLVTLIWMCVFGSNALIQAEQGIGELTNGIDDASLVLFQMLENIPLTEITSGVSIILVLLFFVTSSDSGSLVIDSITAGGKLDAPVPQRVFWAVTEGLIAATLLIGGGAQALGALQAGTIATGLPFTVVLLVMCLSLVIGLREEQKALAFPN
jgi:BCCT family betaine/carnitine transporter